MDIARGEMVEKELNAMIERRARLKDPDEEHELWQESVSRYNAKNGKRTASRGATTSSGLRPA